MERQDEYFRCSCGNEGCRTYITTHTVSPHLRVQLIANHRGDGPIRDGVIYLNLKEATGLMEALLDGVEKLQRMEVRDE